MNVLEQHREDVRNELMHSLRTTKQRRKRYNTTKVVLEHHLGKLQEDTEKEREMWLNTRKDLMGQVKASDGKFVFEKSKARDMVQEQIDKSLESKQKLKNQIKDIKEMNLEVGRMYTQKSRLFVQPRRE